MIIKAYYDTETDFYPVYWTGKQWSTVYSQAKEYKTDGRVCKVASQFRSLVYQLDNNIHSISIR